MLANAVAFGKGMLLGLAVSVFVCLPLGTLMGYGLWYLLGAR